MASAAPTRNATSRNTGQVPRGAANRNATPASTSAGKLDTRARGEPRHSSGARRKIAYATVRCSSEIAHRVVVAGAVVAIKPSAAHEATDTASKVSNTRSSVGPSAAGTAVVWVGWMGLTINREKTRVVSLSKGESLDFLGFTLQYHRDLRGRDHRYLHVMPSKKAMARERAKLRQMTDSRFCFKPIPALIRELNRNLRGWANYFDYGHPRRRFREINWYVRQRLKFHLRRRSQRPFRPPKGVSFYKHLATLGLDYL